MLPWNILKFSRRETSDLLRSGCCCDEWLPHRLERARFITCPVVSTWKRSTQVPNAYFFFCDQPQLLVTFQNITALLGFQPQLKALSFCWFLRGQLPWKFLCFCFSLAMLIAVVSKLSAYALHEIIQFSSYLLTCKFNSPEANYKLHE
jgi:hypothetical protein